MTAYRYPVQQPNIDNGHYEANPSWLVMFIRYAYPASFDRSSPLPANNSSVSRSISQLQSNPVLELDPLLIENDCVNWSTSTSKGSHVSGANVVLANSGIPYDQQISCGDWMIIWAFNNSADASRVANNLRSNGATKQANKFNDGLKFIGRVSGVARKASIDPEIGYRSVFFSVDANGFTDLDAQIYYDSAIAIQYQDSNSFLVNVLGAVIDQFKSKQGFVSTQEIIPVLVHVLLGLGTKDTSAKSINTGDGDQIIVSPNSAYRVPQTLVNILYGSTYPPPQNQVGFTYSDILKMIIGIQKYNSTNTPTSTSGSTTSPQKGFFDTSWTTTSAGNYSTGFDLSATYSFDAISFNDTTVWGILERFVNNPIDEMYTCLRVFPSSDPNNKSGEIYPALVVRQVPFNTDIFVNNAPSSLTATSFFELPRWVIDPTMVLEENFVKSESQRRNYVHIYGQDLTGVNQSYVTAGIKTVIPPVFDAADIQRHGLKAMSRQVPVDTNVLNSTGTASANHPGSYWPALVADQLMDGQNKYTGTLNCKGIQEPICEGDNLEYDGMLFHIERIMHSGNVNLETGKRSFNTALQLSNGVSATQKSSTTLSYGTLPTYSTDTDPEANEELNTNANPNDFGSLDVNNGNVA
jgi:hypothetical protein